MKYIGTLMLAVFWLSISAQADERSEWLAERRSWIEQAKTTPNPKSIENLSRIVRGVGANLDSGSPEARDLYFEARRHLLSTPGHARHFAEELEKTRAKDRTKGRINYAKDLHQYVAETLVHLPSPETVGVLGKMLEDTRDAPPPDDPMRDMNGYTMNPHLAAVALSRMKIRNYPLGRHFQPVFDDFEPWLEWWKEVKAGRKTFSFEGQNVEYRFKPDGTWETLSLGNIPKKERGYGTTTETRTERRPSLSPREQTSPAPRSHQLWIVLLIAISVTIGLCWLKSVGTGRKNA